GLNALDWTDRGVWPFYIRELYSPEFPVVYLNGVLLPFTGISYLSPRLITAFSGLLFVALLIPTTWLLTKGQSVAFRERASLLAGLSGAVSIEAMYLSRLGMESPPFLASLTLMACLTVWAWQGNRLHRWILAGVAAGFAQYIYLPARLIPLLLLVWIVHTWWADRAAFRKRVKGWLAMAGAAFVTALPAIAFFILIPGSFSGRADTGTAITGGWVWNYNTSAQGGFLGLMLKKLGLTAAGLGLRLDGPYSIMGQPILAPLFFIGFLIAIGALIRYPRRITYAWPALAIPVMLITDLISGAVPEVHALHLMGILPFAFILSGIGLAHLWDALAAWFRSHANWTTPAVAGLLAVAIIPSGLQTTYYLNTLIPSQYADPQTGWSTEQIDVDLSRHILARPDKTYLLSYEEYSRSNVAWLLSSAFRQRHSAIDTQGMLRVPQDFATLTVVMTDTPERPRHDARPSELDTRLWVLLIDGQTLLLPPLTAPQEQELLGKLQSAHFEPLQDRSNTEIAKFYDLPTPPGLFAPRQVIDSPLQATFANEIDLKGYSIRDQNLTPGTVVFVTLYWQARVTPSRDYETFAQVWNDNKQALAETNDFPYGGAYRTRIWQPGEIVATHHWLQLPNSLPPARYTLAVGLSPLLTAQRIPVQGASADPSLQVVLSPDLRVPLPPAIPGTPPAQPTRFGDSFAVAGLTASVDSTALPASGAWQAKPGQTLSFDLTWKALKRPSLDYSVFIHLSAAADTPPVAQADSVMGDTYPPGAWRSGDLVAQRLSVKVPDNLVPGTYQWLLGVYYWQDGKRLPLFLGDQQQADAQWSFGSLMVNSSQ
ncbi:MAG TPA: hypothetical protein VKQ72_02410, partial [Aggregatilineales bacterium]|nr:hypothetical protein [Aggregatilineales bacterium]